MRQISRASCRPSDREWNIILRQISHILRNSRYPKYLQSQQKPFGFWAITLAFLVVLGISACSDTDDTGSASQSDSSSNSQDSSEKTTTDMEHRTKPISFTFPEVTVTDLADESKVDLASLTVDKPTLIWFWAPWCHVCAEEAPGIKKLSEEHSDDLTIIGLGARDKVNAGQGFVEKHDLSFRMLFDESQESWGSLRIPAQPAAILLDADGMERKRWFGPLPLKEVTGALASL